jgi:DNA-binding NarL/FixJ family response regulator
VQSSELGLTDDNLLAYLTQLHLEKRTTAMLKVYLADDSQLVRDRLKEVLRETGSIEVIGESGDAEEAMQAIQRLDPDVAILDIPMPGGGGLPVLTDIKAREPSQVVIILTAYPVPQYREKFLAAGADYFFDKTRDIPRMRDVLVELAQQRSGAPKKKIPDAQQ